MLILREKIFGNKANKAAKNAWEKAQGGRYVVRYRDLGTGGVIG